MRVALPIFYCEWCGRALSGDAVSGGYCPIPTCVIVRSQRVELDQFWTEDEARWWSAAVMQLKTNRTVSRCGINVRLALRKYGQPCVYVWRNGGPSLSVDVGPQNQMPVSAIVREIQMLRTNELSRSGERDHRN